MTDHTYDEDQNVHRYLDLSTGFLSQPERDALEEQGRADQSDDRRRDLDLPRVVNHYYGWWVNVPAPPDSIGEDHLGERFPALLACIRVARKRGCNWINFDADASDDDPELQIREDLDASSIEADPMQAQGRGQ